MPELPEVQTTVNGLHQKVLNRTFVDVWSDWEKMVKKPDLAAGGFEVFTKELVGKKIIKVWRRAKNVVFDLSDGYSLLIHQKMTGHLMVGKWNFEDGKWIPTKKGPLEEKINTFLHLMLFLNDGQMIALSDLRKFAKAELWKTKELLEEFKKLGPEPLEKSFTLEKFKDCLRKKRGRVKMVIMDPSVIVGVGNIYASEALWWSKIHPERDVATLTEKELKLLYEAIIKVLTLGVKLGGESFDDYRNVDGKKGHFDTERKAYQREGQKCSRCGTIMKRVMFGGRSAFYCPKEQKL